MGKQDQTKKMDRTADIAASPEGTWSIETFHQAGTTGHATTEQILSFPQFCLLLHCVMLYTVLQE